VICGKTYTERLWCVMELFTFLTMGATLDRVVVLPIAEADEPLPGPQEAPATRDAEEELRSVALSRFRGFDVHTAECYHTHEKHHLIAVIEASYGDYAQFNAFIGNLFSEGFLERHACGGAAGTAQPRLLAAVADSFCVRLH